MKKTIALLLTAALLLTLALGGCSNQTGGEEDPVGQSDPVISEDNTNTTTSTSDETTTTTETTAPDTQKDDVMTVGIEGETMTTPSKLFAGDGYTVKYPTDHVKVKQSEGYDVFEWDAEGIYDYFSVMRTTTPADEAAESFRKEYADYFENVSKDNLTVNGVEATAVYCSESNETVFEKDVYLSSYFIPASGACYIVEIRTSFDTAETIGAYFGAMLESFTLA